MRIRTVSIEGFGPFKEKQLVDFSAFDADGLFLIAGETGVGKSSILDAIAYALYNRTPRWDNVSGTGASNAVRSDFCGVDDVTEVILEFETNGDEYRVTRSPEYERPKSRGEGTTKQNSRILVEVLEDETWVGKATKEREAAEIIEDLIKLTKDEFLQVIMLAQGRFQEFLLADSAQRLDLLSKLFGTERFADYQDRISQRRSALNKRLETARVQQSALVASIDAPEDLGEASPGAEVEWIDRVIEYATSEQKSAKGAAKAAETAEKAALDRLDLARKQERRDAAMKALTDLRERDKDIEETKVVLRRAERAERVRPLLETATEWEGAVADAQSAVDDARLGYLGDSAEEGLGPEVDGLTQQIGALTDELQEEERAARLELELAAKKLAADGLAEKVFEATRASTRLQEERDELLSDAAQFTSAQEAVERSRARLAAAKEAAKVSEKLRAAQEALLAADQRLTAARTHADELLERFLHGQAGILAKKLVDGDPCSVCGSTEHPAPAQVSDNSVSQDDVDAAQSVVSGLEPEAKDSKERVGELKVEAAQLQGAAGNADIDGLKKAVIQAKDALSAASRAVKRIAEIDESLQGDDGLVATRARLESESKEAATEVTKLTTELGSLTKKLARLRGEYPSVKARHESLVTHRDAAKLLANALASLGEASKQRAAANEKLAAKLVQEKFDSVNEVSESLLEEAEVEGLQSLLTTHAAAVSENQGILKQVDLQNLPDTTVVVADAEVAHRDAQNATRAATQAAAKAEDAITRLASQRKELGLLLSATQDLTDEYDTLHRLAETVNGRTPNTKNMTLESYYIAAELEEVLDAANGRLSILSNGRFLFRHTERGVRRANAAAGLEIEVFDEYTGTARPANQLSGGQQFLASLALALGLAEVVTSRAGGIELNTLFIDEGFGSLSAEYLEIAMETLDSLKQGGRTVGVISHVSSMQEQIAAQLKVSAEPGGPSTIVQDINESDDPEVGLQDVA